jgi:hypothetical protein
VWKTTSVASAGCFGHQRLEVVQKVATHDARRVAPGDGKGGPQVAAALVLFRPDQGFQPRHVLVGCDIERIEVEAGAPDDAGQRAGSGAGPVTVQLKTGRAGDSSAQGARVPNRSRSDRAAGRGRPTRRLR